MKIIFLDLTLEVFIFTISILADFIGNTIIMHMRMEVWIH